MYSRVDKRSCCGFDEVVLTMVAIIAIIAVAITAITYTQNTDLDTRVNGVERYAHENVDNLFLAIQAMNVTLRNLTGHA